jgi:hypothetical protein
MSQSGSYEALMAAAAAWRTATEGLQFVLRAAAPSVAPEVVGREPVLAWVSEMSPHGHGDGRSWRAEPCHPYFGDGVAVHAVEDLGEAGERGAGGPFHQLGHLMLADLPSGGVRERVQAALEGVRAAAADYQSVLRSADSDLRLAASTGSDVLELVRATPAGLPQDGLTWRAEPRWVAGGAAAAAVFVERDADDPRRSTLVDLGLVEVPAPA